MKQIDVLAPVGSVKRGHRTESGEAISAISVA